MRGLEFLRSFGLEFWLPLPLLGFVFWMVSGLVTEQSLNLANPSVGLLKISLDQAVPSPQILLIKVVVDRDRQISSVKVQQATQVYQKQEFELPTTQLSQVEATLSQKLGLPLQQIRQVVRYQIKESP